MLREALLKYPDSVVSLASSQCLRFIDEINGVEGIDDEIRELKRAIKIEKRKPKSRTSKNVINSLYEKLYELEFQPDYLCVIMDSNKDYDRANEGFKVNGIRYRRFLGTNGGIKNSTIVYVNEKLYPELKKRLDNGRDKTKELVPAKLEAYQALICSGSTPIPQPKGIIVVNDCITHFKEDVITIRDGEDAEPILEYADDYEIEHNDSDGYGLMLPSYSARVNEYLTGDSSPVTGFNSRYSYTKGMIYTFDYLDFAENVAHTYEIVDAWGDKRDVRDAEVILTVSMVKLWDSYNSYEDFIKNCRENHYVLATPKVAPQELENKRTTNYQFLQSYEFTDDELYELCKPTIDEIKDTMGLDYRKSLAYLLGENCTEKKAKRFEDNYIKALMSDKRMINDPFVRKNIHSMIKKRIESAKKGSVTIDANYAMISGDPYALCQSMFGLEVTGLLKSGELYNRYWIDRGSKEVACFRAPMTSMNNIMKMMLVDNEDTRHWYQFYETAIIFNAWDSACDAMNGADKDGDTNMDTDNPIILKNTRNTRTIMCMQRKASKCIPSEEDIIAANKLAFNDDIGTVTNRVTSMIEVQAGFDKDSAEYKELEYRIMCGQHYQQNTIDRCKGIIAKEMPAYWYRIGANTIKEEDTGEIIKKEFNRRIAAYHKPYFMIYVYPTLKREYKTYCQNSNAKSIMLHGEDVQKLKEKSSNNEFLKFYEYLSPVGENPCTINRISWIFEKEFDGYLSKQLKNVDFDYSILKSNVNYSGASYKAVSRLYGEYLTQINKFHQKSRNSVMDKDEADSKKNLFKQVFKDECIRVCPNEDELCDIVLDLCYQSEKSKQFAWDVCGDVIVKNLLKKNGNTLSFPQRVEDNEEFEFGGNKFILKNVIVGESADDYS